MGQILADSKSNYMVNAEVCTGKNLQPTTSKRKLSHLTQIVLRLIARIANSKRNIAGDNLYASIKLVDGLKKYCLTYVGKARKNKRQILPQFQPNRTHLMDSSLLFFFTRVSHTHRKSSYPSLEHPS